MLSTPGRLITRATKCLKELKSLLSTASSSADLLFSPSSPDLPRRLGRTERKPLVTSVTELKRSARKERKSRQEVREFVLHPPDNGVLVKSLIPVAHEVFDARRRLFRCIQMVMETIPVHSCRICGEIHVGTVPHKIRTCNFSNSLPTKEHSWIRGKTEQILPNTESFHLYDRLGRAVSHEERLQVDRIPAIVELCIQAGVDLPEYPTKRRLFPVYNIAGKLIDYEKKYPRDYSSGKDIEMSGFWKWKNKTGEDDSTPFAPDCSIQEVASMGMKAWEMVRGGAKKLMKKYPVQTCGFCPEVQVGPKGHRARICQAYKHQMRAGQHAWQEATVDDLVLPVFVWHVKNPKVEKPLLNELRMYYGKLPAAVELFYQAGADVAREYWPVMRRDVVVPELEEERFAI